MNGFHLVFVTYAVLAGTKLASSKLLIRPRPGLPGVVNCFLARPLGETLPFLLLAGYFVSTLFVLLETRVFAPQLTRRSARIANAFQFSTLNFSKTEIQQDPLVLVIASLAFLVALRHALTLFATRPALLPEPNPHSAYANSCDICALKHAPHCYHGRHSCVYRFDHFCPWVNADIGAGNQAIFIQYLISNIFFSVYSTVFFVRIVFVFLKKFYSEIGVENQNYNEFLNNISLVLIVFSIENPVIALSLLLQIVVLTSLLIQLSAQIFTLRRKNCWSSFKYAQKIRKGVRSGDIVFGQNAQNFYVLEGGECANQTGKIEMENEVVEVVYLDQNASLDLLKDDLASGRFWENVIWHFTHTWVVEKDF
ncbi:Palmitoyltransferase [Spironucleus salmonicida]|uniref:Palmitoyltransferase n=1 Tax=Spironucleus salmonicida TaxID=348837 RepID=V6LX50_9EUKA|nr:Palmitoyltransferase [Spironucleus salmonicida]|eukprot:EST48818.1 DHHC zinc finger and transmembrane domain-containing protein [Spironucleus salmonicida]